MANRNLDRVVRPDFLGELSELRVEQIRQKRQECQQLEDAASYLRRLIQGRLDVIGTEIRARAAGEVADLSTLVEQLPSILAEHGDRSAFGRMVTTTPGDEQEAWATARVDAACEGVDIAMTPDLSDQQLYGLTDALSALEREVSIERRKLHDLIDKLQAELIRRYKTGEASVEGLLR